MVRQLPVLENLLSKVLRTIASPAIAKASANPFSLAEVGAAVFLVPSSVSGSGKGRAELFFFRVLAAVVAPSWSHVISLFPQLAVAVAVGAAVAVGRIGTGLPASVCCRARQRWSPLPRLDVGVQQRVNSISSPIRPSGHRQILLPVLLHSIQQPVVGS